MRTNGLFVMHFRGHLAKTRSWGQSKIDILLKNVKLQLSLLASLVFFLMDCYFDKFKTCLGSLQHLKR